ncbi:MAG: redox-regulated ATPase YchF [Candidatus Cloacimonetes bacterium]|nr:redox-regulated ATPase YchF [Candidatus Cloacimonadota bacterium]MBL7148534.1 redox-regulated ATPase YchF [Candidatus Cloacimonadota bacterium]
MKIGLIGLPNSGKTTIFNALTGLDAEISSYSTQKTEPNLGIVKVIDERISKLAEFYEPKKIIHATIEYIDFAGLPRVAGKESLSNSLLTLAKTTDALAAVVRNFKDEIIDQTLGKPDPLADIEIINTELILSDLIIAEKRLEKIELSLKRGVKNNELMIEEKAVRKAIESLNKDIPLRNIDFPSDEEKSIRGFQFLSQKPMMIILNSDEKNLGHNSELQEKIRSNYKVMEFAGNFEMELSKLMHEEQQDFMADMNIKESARDRLTKLSYELLGYISFFTIGKDEVRAWTIVNGENAVDAAGKVHSDLARGFIRAECFSYEDLIRLGSEKALREKGLFRLEGKNYIVKDGDVLKIRFSI